MLRLRQLSPNYRELFVARYEQLLTWALQLSHGERTLAEDLLHDLYVLFSIHEPNIDPAQNVDGYLYTCLRNLYLSHLRRTTRVRFQQLSIIEYESAKTGLRAIDPRMQIEVQDELRRVCQYACARKETSRMGSVLILRFFHGYYPSEIVRILCTSRKAVDRRLALARAEAKTYLDNRESLAFINSGVAPPEIFPANFARTPAGLLGELRQMIFSSRRGDCISQQRFQHLYQPSKKDDRADEMVSISCAELAHFVSCATCLDKVNGMLQLPPLSQRHLTDTTCRDPGDHDGDSGGRPTGGGSLQLTKSTKARKLIESGRLDAWDDDARETFEHKPQELCVVVNGYLLGSQRVGLEQNDLTLSLNPEENPSFIEIFSEQGIRLSLMSVGDPPPEGTGEQHLHVKLSDARALDLSLHFTSPLMTFHVAYHDPALRSEAEALETEVECLSLPSFDQQPITSRSEFAVERLSNVIRSLRARLFTSALWLKPEIVTAVVVLILLAALLLYLRTPTPSVTAADLLRHSVASEQLSAAQPDTIVHRTINVEEKNGRGEVITRSKVEIWQSAGQKITARRLYNERGELIAGDWRRHDGVQTIYHHGAHPQIRLSPDQSDAAMPVPTFDNAWQLSLSAKEFNRLVADTAAALIEERPDGYVIAYVAPASTSSSHAAPALVRTSLFLSRGDLHPIEQTLVIRMGGETREYRLVETVLERRAPGTVPHTVFEPDAELLSERSKSGPKKKNQPAFPSPGAPTPVTASTELEVEVLSLIHHVGADLGDEVTVRRAPGGKLQVQGIVENESRKAEIVRALASLANNPAVEIRVNTVAEALKGQTGSQSSSGPAMVERRESTDTRIPLDAELRGYFSAKALQGDELNQRVNEFAAQIGNRSLRVLRHAGALQRLAHRFSPEQLRTLEPEARTKWRGILREHAQALQRELVSLRQDLRPFADSNAGIGSQDIPTIDTDHDLQQVTNRLLELCSANDQSLRSAFTASPNSSNSDGIKSPRFWSSLSGAEIIAARIAGGH
jgi:RNA polymerase sigma factor (sigma-70 family)